MATTKSKYSALEETLKKFSGDHISMTFSEIERIIGRELPPSAFDHRPWWSNNPSNSSITSAWLNAGFKTEQVDMKARRLVFRRIGTSKSERIATDTIQPPRTAETARSYTVDLRHPLFGALKGTIRVAPGTDLSEPADPEWGDK